MLLNDHNPQSDLQTQHCHCQSPAAFFAEMYKLILKFIRNSRGFRVARQFGETRLEDSHFPISYIPVELHILETCGAHMRM